MHGIRTGVRIPLELAVQVRWQNPGGSYRQVRGKTGTISGNGMYVTVPERAPRRAPITFTIALPSEVTRVPVKIYGKGRIIHSGRVNGGAGLGVVIDNYQLRRVH